MRGAAKRKWNADWHLEPGDVWMDSVLSHTADNCAWIRSLIHHSTQSPCEMAFAEALMGRCLLAGRKCMLLFYADVSLNPHPDAPAGSFDFVADGTRICPVPHFKQPDGDDSSVIFLLIQPNISETGRHPDFVVAAGEWEDLKQLSAGAFYVQSSSARSIAVEIDGHDFHDRTKEQASADRERDRGHLALGLRTARFTGSDVYRDADKCIDETLSLLGVA
jgi:hypothetical protein